MMKKMRTLVILLTCSIALNIIFLYRAYQRRIKWDSSGQRNIDYARARADIFNLLPDDDNEIIFVGNSLTDLFPTNEWFPNKKTKNRGISNDGTRQVLNRISDVTRLRPAKIFLEIGINDIKYGVPLDTAFSNLVQIIYRIKYETPSTAIYVNCVFPVADTSLIERIKKYNQKVKVYCDSNGCTFIDLYQKFEKQGAINPQLTYDGVHFNASGYQLWAAELLNYL